MKLNPVAFGTALGGAMAILFLVCGIFAYTSPDLVVSISKSIVHGLDISPLVPAAKPEFVARSFLTGWVFLSLFAWLFGWLGGNIYNLSNRGRSPA